MKKVIILPLLIGGACGLTANAQYNMLDASFGDNGHVTTAYDLSYDAYGSDVAIQADGKIIAVGQAHEPWVGMGFALFRYHPDGEPDTSFNHTGQVVYLPNQLQGGANAVVIQPDGKILAGGYVVNPGYKDFALIRFMPDGSVDSSFGTNGMTITTVSSRNDEILELALHADGKIVAAGYAHNSSELPSSAIAQYLPNGMPDNSFSGDGKLTFTYGSYSSEVYGLALQPNGKIVVGGYASTGMDASFAVARFLSNGTLDTTFAGTGKTVTQWSGFTFMTAFMV